MKIDLYSYTNNGKYDINEDSLYCGKNAFVVADGLGGCNYGELASQCAVKYIEKNYKEISLDRIDELLIGANNAVFSLGNGACTTIAAVFIDGNELRYANVGDSRVYYFRDGNIIAQTKDHSVCQAAVDAGIINADEIRESADRSKLFNVLGEHEKLKPVKPYDAIQIKDNDAFLICSDGFWEYVLEIEMENDLKKSNRAKKWAKLMLQRHLKNINNDCDNYSLICGIISK